MTPEKRADIRRNLFPASHAAIEDFDAFPWHVGSDNEVDTDRPHSSQALSIDVFGTLKTFADRDAACAALASAWDLPGAGPWTISLEFSVGQKLLGEPTSTQVDALLMSPNAVICVESKFTEREGGGCSQTRTLRRKGGEPLRQCDGNYRRQTNPVNGIEARCALTGKGIRYWEHIPGLFGLDAAVDHCPCPFKGSWYQWMRNVVTAHRLAVPGNRTAAFVLAYASSASERHLPIQNYVATDDWKGFRAQVNAALVKVHATALGEIVSTAQAGCRGRSREVLSELQEWIGSRVSRAVARTKRRPQSHTP